jgi:hypothetical protein
MAAERVADRAGSGLTCFMMPRLAPKKAGARKNERRANLDVNARYS